MLPLFPDSLPELVRGDPARFKGPKYRVPDGLPVVKTGTVPPKFLKLPHRGCEIEVDQHTSQVENDVSDTIKHVLSHLPLPVS